MWEGNTWETNILHKEKLSLPTYNAGKKSYTIICRGKKFPQTKFPQTKSLKYPPPPLLKSRMFDPLDM